MKLFKCGFGVHQTYVVANTESEAIQKASDSMGIPFLPVTAEEVTVHGYDVQVVPTGKGGGDTVGDIRQEGEGSKGDEGGKGPDKPTRRKSGARQKSDK
jgi:hypothetical protein